MKPLIFNTRTAAEAAAANLRGMGKDIGVVPYGLRLWEVSEVALIAQQQAQIALIEAAARATEHFSEDDLEEKV